RPLAVMTTLGRELVGSAAELVRHAVVDFAARREWLVLRHQSFVEWASAAMNGDENRWLVLDPLFPIEKCVERVRRVHVSRRFDNNQTIAIREYVTHDDVREGDLSTLEGTVGLVDDAA